MSSTGSSAVALNQEAEAPRKHSRHGDLLCGFGPDRADACSHYEIQRCTAVIAFTDLTLLQHLMRVLMPQMRPVASSVLL